jgi:hypothetical protein
MTPRSVASILHGAYGDYYEQAVCLKSYRLDHPEVRLKLFAADAHRFEELRTLDFSWADCFEMHTEVPRHRVDEFLQFQVRDGELQRDVFSRLSSDIVRKIDFRSNLLPWRFLRSILPLTSERQLDLSEFGRGALSVMMKENGIAPEVFQRPTIGFLWRYRGASGAVRGALQADAEQLVAKYSRIFRRLIDAYGCHILVCGMKVQRTPENKHRIDAKYPEYGLDLPEESCTHLKALNWAVELEILSRCTVCVANPSGFSEALWIKRGMGVILVDPPPHYLAKAVWHRAPFFNLQRPSGLISAVASRREESAYARIRSEIDLALMRPADRAVTTLQSIAP